MKAVITVIGTDSVGILAGVSAACAGRRANILEVTQSVLDGYFCMVMVVQMDESANGISLLQRDIQAAVPDMVIHVMHEDIFNSMHRI